MSTPFYLNGAIMAGTLGYLTGDGHGCAVALLSFAVGTLIVHIFTRFLD